MNILDTFYVLYKSNADDVVKGNQRIDKSAKETERSLKGANEQSDKLGQSFVKAVEGIASLAGAFAGFNFIKNGVMQQIDYNKQLTITTKLLGQNAETWKQIAQRSAEAGGSREGALANLQSLSQLAYERNQTLDPEAYIGRIRNRIKGAVTVAGKNRILDAAGLTDPGLRAQAMMSDADYAASKASGSKVTLNSEAQQNAMDANKAREALAGAEGNLFQQIGNSLIPKIDALIGQFSDFLAHISGSKSASLGVGAGIIGGSALATGLGVRGLLGMAGRMLGLGAAAAPEISGAAFSASTFGGAGVAAAGGASLAAPLAITAFLAYLGYDKYMSSVHSFGNWVRGKKSSPTSDLSFWMGKGYSKEQAAAINANMMAESGGDPNSVGDGGHARGLFQWHKSRRDEILKGSGIDVWNSSKGQQLEAAFWEMQHGSTGFNDKRFRGMGGASAAGSYFSNNFEYPKDRLGQAIRRGQSALSLASSYQGSGGGPTNVTIDKIEIHTAATDAHEIAHHIKSAMIGACSDVQSKVDNGRFS